MRSRSARQGRLHKVSFFLILTLFILLMLSLSVAAQPLITKEQYGVEEPVTILLPDGTFNLKLRYESTPPKTFSYRGASGVVQYTPDEPGDYTLTAENEEHVLVAHFTVIARTEGGGATTGTNTTGNSTGGGTGTGVGNGTGMSDGTGTGGAHDATNTSLHTNLTTTTNLTNTTTTNLTTTTTTLTTLSTNLTNTTMMNNTSNTTNNASTSPQTPIESSKKNTTSTTNTTYTTIDNESETSVTGSPLPSQNGTRPEARAGGVVPTRDVPIVVEQHQYALGEEVVILVYRLTMKERLYLLHGDQRFRFMGSGKRITYRPTTPGTYTLLYYNGGTPFTTNFTVTMNNSGNRGGSLGEEENSTSEESGSQHANTTNPAASELSNKTGANQSGTLPTPLQPPQTSPGFATTLRNGVFTPQTNGGEWVPTNFLGEYDEKSISELASELLNEGEWVSAKNAVAAPTPVKEYALTKTGSTLSPISHTIAKALGLKSDIRGKHVEKLLLVTNQSLLLLKNVTVNDTLRLTNISPSTIKELHTPLMSVQRGYAIDPSRLRFQSGSLLTRARGNLLYKCADWEYDAATCHGEWRLLRRITPGEYYELPLTPQDPAFIEVGLATLNTNKPLYHPGENALLTAAVLDTSGAVVSGAHVTITITHENATTRLVMHEQEKGRYQANFTPDTPGNYTLLLTANSTNVNTNFTTFFAVRETYPYDIIRRTPMIIDPWSGPVSSTITITPARADAPLPVMLLEALPRTFNVTNSTADAQFVINDTRYLLWGSVNDTVWYSYQAPLVSPELYFVRARIIVVPNGTTASSLLDHLFPSRENRTLNATLFSLLLNTSFQEARPWFIAADPTVDMNNAGDIDMTTLDNHTIVFAWYDTGDSDVSFEVWDTNGTRLVDETDVDTSAGANSRVSVSALNRSQFVIAYTDSTPTDLFQAIYNRDGSNSLPVTQLDPNVGARTDVSTAELGTEYVVCDANDADNDADYRIFDNTGSTVVGESNVDGNMAPGANGQNLVDCDAVSSSRWVYLWFDDQSNDATISLVSNGGTVVSGPRDIDTNVGETGQVAVAANSREKMVASLYYDSSLSDIFLEITNVSTDSFVTVLAPTAIDTNAGSSSRVSIDELDWKGTPYWVATWQDTASGDIKAAVYDLQGNEITAPFSAITTPSGTYQLIDVEAGNSLLGTGLCTGVFVIGYTDSAGTANFARFWYNGSLWNGICPNFPPTHSQPIIQSSAGHNETTEDLYCYNQSTSDYEHDPVRNIYTWSVNGSSIEVLNTPFEGGSNSTWTRDYSGNNNDGLVSGATWNATGGIVGGAYEFDGLNDYIRFQGDDLSTTGQPFTVSFWFKPRITIDSSISQRMTLIEKREGAGANDWMFNFDTNDAGRMRWRSYQGNVQTTRNTWVAGTWYHVVGVYGADNDVHIYVNGAEDNRNNDYNIGTLTQSTEDIWVGTRYNGNDDFNGTIDELRIYNRALTPAEVQALYNRQYNLLKSDETSVGDNWSCAITPNDGYSDGLTLSSANLTVKPSTGSPPSITSVSDAPDPIALGNLLTINATVTDPDNNLDSVWVLINGTNYSMSNVANNLWSVTINTTGFATGTLTYTVYANDTVDKQNESNGTVEVTNTLAVDVSTGGQRHYIGELLNVTTNVTIATSPVDGASVTTDIVKVTTTSEPVTPWWNTSFKHRVTFTLDDTSGKNRTNYWVHVPLTLDADCSLDAHNTSLRLVDDEGKSLSFLQWNVTPCSSNPAYISSLWISFRLNLSANQERNFSLYSDNGTHTQVGTSQGPMRIVFVDQGSGSGNFPDTTDIQNRYDTALQNLGLSPNGFYDTLSTSRSASDVPYSSLSPYAIVHYSAGSKYRNSWDATEASNLFKFVNQSGSLLVTGPDLGFDADEDGWIFNSAFRNLTHMSAGFQDDSNANNALVQTSHPITKYLSSSFQMSDTYPDGYTALIGPVVADVYHWDAGNPYAGTANDGLYDTSCPGMCGKTVYYAGAIVDTAGNGITVGTDREKFLRGVLDWFLNNRSASFTQGGEQDWRARQTGTTSSGAVTLGFNTSAWTNGTYAAVSLGAKGGYENGTDYAFFTMERDYTTYPNITSISDTPDPVPLGNLLTITATVTDADNNTDSVWVLINGTNYSMSNTTPTSWNVTINTTGFSLGTLTYTVYANDTDGHDATPRQGTVEVSNAFQASIGTDKTNYIIGETVTATTQTYLAFNPTSAAVVTDIVEGVTDTPWWNTSWKRRIPFNLTSPDGTDRVNEIVRVNITGLNGNITSCANELRIISGAGGDQQVEVPFTLESGDNTNWCYVRFLANITGGQPARYHAYYNNSGAANPGYATVPSSYVKNPDLEATTDWTYYETETADTGTYTTTQANSPTHSYNIYSGSSGTAGNYGEIYQDVTLPCVGCQVSVSAYNRLESAGSTANAFYAQIIMNSTIISSVGTPPSSSSPTDWTKRTGTYTTTALTERLHLRLLTDVTYTGGSYGRRDVFWDDVAITLSNPASMTQGSSQRWMARKNGTTSASTGLLSLPFDSANYTNTTYTAVTLAEKSGYENASDWTTFTMMLNTSGYPQITNVTDTPDPVLYGQSITFNATITDDTGVSAAWIIVDGTTRYNLTNSTGNPSLWTYTLDTTGYRDGLHNYTVYANDTEGHTSSNGTFAFTVKKKIVVDVTGDKSAYTTGDLAIFLTNATLINPLTGGTTTNDIIMGSSPTTRSWWNTGWERRKPLTVTEPDGTARTDAIIEVNVTGLDGNITSCNELRIVDYGSDERGVMREAKIFGGDDANWCLVRFYANLSASESTTTRFYAYYNNSGASAQATTKPFAATLYYDDGENTTLRNSWTRDPLGTDGATSGWFSWGDPQAYTVGSATAQPENDVTAGSGIYALFTGPLGDNTGTGAQGDVDGGTTTMASGTINLSGWSKVNISFYLWFFSNDNGANNDDTCALRASTNGGTSYNNDIIVLHDDDVGSDPDYYNSWQQFTYRLDQKVSTLNDQFRLLADGEDYGDGDVVECGFDEFNITGFASDVSASAGSTEQFIQRTTNTTNTSGLANFFFDTTGQAAGSYLAVSLVEKSPYEAGIDGFPFTIAPDSPPTVTLTSPANNTLTNSTSITFQCSATDDFNLVNMTLYTTISGSWQSNGTVALSGTSDSASFPRSVTSDGTYLWNCRAFDNSSQSSFATNNNTLIVDLTPPTITLHNPANNTLLAARNVLFSYSADDLHGVTSCSLFINGTLNQTSNTIDDSPQYFATSFSDGSYRWSIHCTDAAGNTRVSEERDFTVAATNTSYNGTWYERSSFSCTDETCAITLSPTRNATEHTVTENVVTPGTEVTIVEAASPFLGANGAFLPGGSLVNFSGEFLSNPVAQGLVSWRLSAMDSSLATTTICQDLDNPLFSLTTGSCTVPGDTYLAPDDLLFLEINFTNDETHNVSLTHYWDGTRNSFLDLNLTTVGFLHGAITYPPTSSVDIAQGAQQVINCTYNCTGGSCLNTKAYLQYNPGTGFENVSTSGGLTLALGQQNPLLLGNLSDGENATASFTVIGNQTGTWTVRCEADSVAEAVLTGEVDVNVGDNTPPEVTLQAPTNNSFTTQDPAPFTYFANDSSGIDNCTLYINGVANVTNTTIISGTNNTLYSSLATGTYNWTVSCYDSTGLEGSAGVNWTVNVDVGTPNITLITPINTTVDASTVTFNWSVLDDWDANVTCNLTIDGSFDSNHTLLPNGTPYSYTQSGFSTGQHWYDVTCWDLAGNTATANNVYFNVTDSAPSVVLIDPANNSVEKTSSITLIYNVNENNALQYCDLYLNGSFYQRNTTPVVIGSDNNFTITPSDGRYNWSVHCNDSGGQTGISETWRFLKDATPPSITLLSPPDLAVYTTMNNVTISFNATDAFSTNLTCNLTINGNLNETMNVTSGVPYSTEKTGLGDAHYDWNVTCSDAAGNVNTSTTDRYTINNTPAVSAVSPTNNSFTTQDVTFTYYVDDNDNIASCSLYLDGTLNQSNTEISEGTNNNFTATGLSEGLHTWSVRCVDSGAFNNLNETPTLSFIVDTTLPTVVLNSPANGTVINDSSATLNWTATDNDASTMMCNLTLDGTVNNTFSVANNTPFNTTVTGLPNGWHNWSVTCSDDAGNINTSVTWWFFNNVPPSVYLYAPSNMSFNRTGNWTFIYEPVINDPYAESAYFTNCSLYLNGVLNQTNTSPLRDQNNTFTLTNVAEGLYNWSVLCYENSGAYGESETWFFVEDQSPPQPTITTTNTSWFNTPTPTITFNITDNFNYSVSYQFFVDGAPDSGATGSVTPPASSSDTLSSLSEGNHTVLLEATDQAGNSRNSTAITIIIDVTPPALTLLAPPDNATIENDTVTFNYTVNDVASPNVTCSLYLDGVLTRTNVTTVPATLTNTISGLSAGSHSWYVTCTDVAGNVNTSATRSFFIPVPDLVITSGNITFSNSTPIEGQNITINATIFNIGNSSADNFTVQFWLGDPDNGGTQIGSDRNVSSLAPGANLTLSTNYTVVIGQNDIYVLVDTPLATNGSVREANESNNKDFNGFQVGFYNIFSGLTQNSLRVADTTQAPVWKWNVSNATGSNLFIVDEDSAISFTALQALGRDTNNNSRFEDFAQLDTQLGSTDFVDNINATWTRSNAPRATRSYTIYGSLVTNVPVVNSTNTSAFQTGILWDTSDGGVSFDGTQDVVFVTQINESQTGSRGTYDYEVRVPATLRAYTGTTDRVAFYAELT